MRTRFKSAILDCQKAIAARFDFGDLMFVAAVAAVGYGVAQVYPPASWIIVGIIFIIVAVKKSQGGEK